MASLGKPLVVIGVLLLISAGSGASRAPTTGRLVGMFLPGVLCLAAGARLGGMRARPASEAVWAEPGTEADEGVDRLQRAATLGVLGGISLIALGGVAARLGPLGWPVVSGIAALGLASIVWGCIQYARWRGYSGWLGLLGYLLLIGLAILVILPSRRRKLFRDQGPNFAFEREALRREDQDAGRRFLLGLVPAGLIYLAFLGNPPAFRPADTPIRWERLAPSGAGFHALMPGPTEQGTSTADTPNGKAEIRKFTAALTGRREFYNITAILFPTTIPGAAEEMAENGLRDILTSFQAQVEGRRPIVLPGSTGVEFEALASRGGTIKGRVYATDDRIYMLTAVAPKGRNNSANAGTFLGSFRLDDTGVERP